MYSDFISLGTNVLFQPQNPSLHVFTISAWALPVVTVSLSFLVSSSSWLFWRLLISYFVECSSTWVSLSFSPNEVQCLCLGKEYRRSNIVSSTVHPIRVMLICYLLVMVTLITWLSWCLPSFSTVITTFPFVTDTSGRGWDLEAMQMSCFSSLTNFGMHWCCLPVTVIAVIFLWQFPISFYFFTANCL